MLRKTLFTLLTPVFLTTSAAHAQYVQTAPAPVPAPVPGQTTAAPLSANDIFTALGNGSPLPGMQGLGNTFSSIDSTIAMLSRTIDLLMMVPVIGPFAAGLKPVLNTYIDMKATIQPLIDAGNRGIEYVKRIQQAQATVKRIFSSSNFPDAVNSINSIITQFGGFGASPLPNGTMSSANPRQQVAQLLSIADGKIAAARRAVNEARAAGDLPRYRAMLQKEAEFKALRTRLRQAGDAAASQQDNAELVARTSKAAVDAATRSQQQARNMQATVSAEGALKVLGTMAIEELNVQASGFDALSQQLALISQQQVVTNEQNDQLLSHFQKESREQAARHRQAIEEDTQRQEEDYKSMVNRVDSLSDSIGQTLKPSSDRRSNLRDLMRGE